MDNQKLPFGWRKNERGAFEYRFLPCDLEEIKKSRLRLLISVLINIICIITMIFCFCSQH
jgi:hypothetical protein